MIWFLTHQPHRLCLLGPNPPHYQSCYRAYRLHSVQSLLQFLPSASLPRPCVCSSCASGNRYPFSPFCLVHSWSQFIQVFLWEHFLHYLDQINLFYYIFPLFLSEHFPNEYLVVFFIILSFPHCTVSSMKPEKIGLFC